MQQFHEKQTVKRSHTSKHCRQRDSKKAIGLEFLTVENRGKNEALSAQFGESGFQEIQNIEYLLSLTGKAVAFS
jgi:hypothetical protein